MGEHYRIAIYLRLSKEDEELADESSSIANQRTLLEGYAKKHFEHYELKEFVDDGFSGINFCRPGVSRLLVQIKDGRIDCVLVKDFSRFSRDYIELGSYLEQIFPFLGVRFISLNDNYDSKRHKGNTAELDIPFKGLMYDLYLKDLSVKVKSSLRSRKEQGQYACGMTPFGYEKLKGDRHMLAVAEEEAKIVRRIFSLALERKTSVQIARLLNGERVPAPIEFKIKKKQASKKPIGKNFQWSHTAICSILRNPVYTGDMVYDKYEKDGVGGKKHLKPRSEWKIYKNHHEAIVSRDDFEKVQEMKKQAGSKETKAAARHHPLQGKVLCGNCKRAMALRKGTLNPYFYCTQRYVSIDAKDCVSNLNVMFLEQFVLYQLHLELSKQEELEELRQKKENEVRREINAWKKEKEELGRKQAVLQRKRMEEYEKAVFQKNSSFQTEDIVMQHVKERMAEIDKEITKLEEQLSTGKNSVAGFFRQGCMAELTEKLAEKFIQKITVYGEENIEIKWTFDKRDNAGV